MTPTPVGMRCPDCSKERTKVVQGVPSGLGSLTSGGMPATMVLIGLNVIFFLAEIATGTGGLSSDSGSLINDLGLQGVAVNNGEYYRIVTSGFMHAGLLHIGFNMFALYFLGQILEPTVGTPRFIVIYLTCLLAGSFGALLLSGNSEVTVGASGAIFGLFGATFVIAGWRGASEVARGIGMVLVINLVLTFAVGGISIGGHLGGLVAGLICGGLIGAGERGYFGKNGRSLEYVAMIAIAAIAVFGAIAISEPATTIGGAQVIRIPG